MEHQGADSLVRSRFLPRNEPERLGWVEMEVVCRWRRGRLASFEGCDSLPDFLLAGLLSQIHSRGFRSSNWSRDSLLSCSSSGGVSLPSRSNKHEIVECAFRSLKLAAFRKDAHDIPISVPPQAQLVD